LGELDIHDVLEKQQLDEIAEFFTKNNTQATAAAKEHFGDKYSYGELRLVVGWLRRENAA
jgi:hypothetical protein